MYKYLLFFLIPIYTLPTTAQVVEQDSIKTQGKVVTYEEYKKQQIQNDSLEAETILSVEIPVQEIAVDTTISGTPLKIYPEVDDFDEKLLNELYNNDLYDYMYDEIVQMDYSETVNQTLPTDTLKARLAIINETTPFQIDYNPILEKLINKKLSYQRVYMERLMTLSDYYFPMFEPYLDQYDIPLEMKYLAVVESALDPRIKSRVGATGLWQFMFTTGRNYDLEVNSYVDERMDPIKSTQAACKFMRSLYNIYGDWDLVLAAYNSGPGNVNKAIRRSGGYKNYWNIRPYLPRETAGYVPAFQAMMYLFKYAPEHGFQPQQTIYKSIATDTIRVKRTISLEHVAQFTDQDLEVVQFHNPSYKLDIIPVVKGRNYSLRLPIRDAAKFVSNEDDVYAFAKAEFEKKEKPIPELLKAESRIVYRVKSGDYLGKIANRYGVRVSQIKRWNSLRSNNLSIGQRLYIHSRNPITSSSSKSTKTPNTYKVKSGDSLWKIANKYGISIASIRKLNPSKSQNLKAGTTLKLK
ncbi:membrane-bound lytic murein transglycosylase D [Nonlabens dokdonensis]|uniref:Membrane-bound lytic murein transglycosylase D n=2 Tax=Nonlabens dokdonensis TaxID=328515 RepID=A0ABX5Q2D4_9FLAO|nr:lytic transglycosylase domain-containing protein [Nonlabens dokdonensis]AGC76557.1 putative lytic murein transglycosylase [Nonlabens dokdonensis DSW-6]PZX44208.1 membrane-bound lytic murein transglycosylase D [Nonlabens dokdonensis]